MNVSQITNDTNDSACFYLTLAATLQPFYNAYGAYSPTPSDPTAGLATESFNASFGSSTTSFFRLGGFFFFFLSEAWPRF
jgi:hypothetical protein